MGWCESELSSWSGQVLGVCFSCPDGLSARRGRGTGCPPALPPGHRRRSTRPRCPTASAYQAHSSLPREEKAPEMELNGTVFIIKQVYVTLTFCSPEQECFGQDITAPLCPFLPFRRPVLTFVSSRFFVQCLPSFILPSTVCLVLQLAVVVSERCQGGCGDPQMVRVVPAQRDLGQVPLSD